MSAAVKTLAEVELLGLNAGALTRADEPVDTLARLRAIIPRRALGWREAEQLAERQADRVRSTLDVIGPRLTERHLTALPWLGIERAASFPLAGAITQTDYGWIIALRDEDPLVRQRFTLAHELKHVLDDEPMRLLPGGLYPAIGGYGEHERTERVCDRFAAALLMPRRLLRADWADGLQDIAKLAARYHVSREAMTIRLSQLGLTEPRPRCAGMPTHDPAAKARTS